MSAKWFALFAVLLLSAVPAQPKKDGGKERVSAFATIMRHFQRVYLLFRDRLVSMFADAEPLIDTLTEDVPEIATETNSIMQTIHDMYNNDRFLYLQEDMKALFHVFIKPILVADDQCVLLANEQVVSMLQPNESEVASHIHDRIKKIERLMRDTQYLLDSVLDGLMDKTEDAIARGKKCADDRSKGVVVCLHGVIMPWAQEIDDLFAQDQDFIDFTSNFQELTGEITSAGGNVKGMVESVLKDVWFSFAVCMEHQRRRKLSHRRRYPMLG